MVASLAACIAVLLAVSTKPAAAAFPGANGKIAFEAELFDTSRSQIFTIEPKRSGQEARELTDIMTDGYLVTPAFSPNGKKIAYVRWSNDFTYDGEIYLMNADGSGKVNLTKSAGRYEGAPAFYPSGRQVVFAAQSVDENGNYQGPAELYSLSFDKSGDATSSPRQLTDNAFFDTGPVISPNGKKIAFVSARGTGESEDTEIYVMNTAPEGPNNRPVQLTDNAYDDGSPDFSPDGKKIVYDSVAGYSDREIMIMNAKDGTSKKNLTNNSAKDYAPVFSPDGNMVAFNSERGGTTQIWKMRANGTKPKQVTPDAPYYSYFPDWQPLP
jgi:TolB protein